VVNWVSPCLSFFFSASIVAAYIFNAPTCKVSIISLEPCALNADFQHFIPRFNKISLLCGYPWKKGLGWKEAQRLGDVTNNFSIYIYTYTPQNIYMGPCKCIWQIFTLASCKCKKYIYTLQQDKCKCKKFECDSVNNLHLHWIYMPYIWLLTLTCTTLFFFFLQ
jgi:hypothetical protein